MKIECRCGNFLPDSTDYIPYKASLVADQDRFDLIDAICANVQALFERHGLDAKDGTRLNAEIFHAVAPTLRLYERSQYLCGKCGRLLLERRGEPIFDCYSFKPDDPADSKGALRSKKMSQWRGSLTAHWGAGSLSPLGGSIWWDCGDGESGIEEFSEWEKLELRYHELFALLHGRDVLRGSSLRKDGEWVHTWRPPNTA